MFAWKLFSALPTAYTLALSQKEEAGVGAFFTDIPLAFPRRQQLQHPVWDMGKNHINTRELTIVFSL